MKVVLVLVSVINFLVVLAVRGAVYGSGGVGGGGTVTLGHC